MTNGEDDRPVVKEVVWDDDSGTVRSDRPAERVLSIQNVAKMFGVSRMALRYYEIRGLIRRRHSLDGVQVYGWADCERLALIIKCRKAGMALGDIVMIVQATEHEISPLQFKIGQETCTALIDQLERRRRIIDEALAELSHIHGLLTSRMLGGNRRD